MLIKILNRFPIVSEFTSVDSFFSILATFYKLLLLLLC